MCIFVLKLGAMKRLFFLFAFSLLLSMFGLAQNNELQNYKSAFDVAYQACRHQSADDALVSEVITL